MKWLWDIEPHGFLRPLGPVIRRMGAREELANWKGLKHVMEAQLDAKPGSL